MSKPPLNDVEEGSLLTGFCRERMPKRPPVQSCIIVSPLARFQNSNSIHAHRRVAFPLPGVSLVFRWLRPKRYQQNPETLGGHLLKRRSETGLTQKTVASQLEVNIWTYLLWEPYCIPLNRENHW